MPETTMDEDSGVVFGKNEVGPAREIPPVQTKPETTAVQKPADQDLRLRILGPYSGHHPASLGRSYNVCH